MRSPCRVWILPAVLAAVGAFGATTPVLAKGEIEEQALSVLKRSTEFISKLKQFRVTAEVGFEVLQESGQKLEFGQSVKTVIRRPNHLRAEAVRRDGTKLGVLFDGKNVTTFSVNENVYASVPKTGDLDTGLDYITGDLGIPLPLSDFFYSDPASILAGRATSMIHAGDAIIAGVPCEYVAARNDDVDFQIWIAKGDRPLPRRYVIHYKNEEGQPQFWAFLEWDVEPEAPDSLFAFDPPEGADRIQFVASPAPSSGGKE
jgi:hypothetical protein